MLQLALWTWSTKFFNSKDRLYNEYYTPLPWDGYLEPNTYSVDTIKSLVELGAELHCRSGSGHTILDGLVLNLTQFDGSARPAELLTSCIDGWLSIIRDLGIDVREYIRYEAEQHDGEFHDLGYGLRVKLCFDMENSPHVYAGFQGPQEIARQQFVDHISQCAVWPAWQRAFALPKPPHRPRLPAFPAPPDELIIINEQEITAGDDKESFRSQTDPVRTLSPIYNMQNLIRFSVEYAGFLAQNRHEFAIYTFVLTSIWGFDYLSRFGITTMFFVALEVLHVFVL